MALNDNATLVIGSGNYLTAPVGTALPAALTAPTIPWASLGHTSLEDIFSITSEGGEATTIGTLQNKSLRTKYSARTETIAVTLQQFDDESLRMFFGSNMELLASGLLGVPNDPVPVQKAFLAVFLDGEHFFGIYAPKTEIYRADDFSASDTESLAGLPIGIKPLPFGTNKWTYAITPLGRNATGATAGTPGQFTPVGAVPPFNLAAMSSITASPATAWTTGQYVELGDSSDAHWSGTAWVVGVA